jgi:hypothetical protein
MIEEVNGGDNLTDLKNTNPNKKDHPHPWKNGTQLNGVCQILFLRKHKNINK